jgi:hypothetical protein
VRRLKARYRQDPDISSAAYSVGVMSGTRVTTRGLSEDLTPSRFVGLKIQLFFLFALLLPIAFMVLRVGKIQIIPSDWADLIVASLTYVYPVLWEQYASIRQLGSPAEASNYSVLFLFLFAFSATYLGYVVHEYLKVRDLMIRTSWQDVFVVTLCSIGAVYAVFFDVPKTFPKPIFNFYVDAGGFYLLRQSILFTGAYMTAMFALISIIRGIDRPRF